MIYMRKFLLALAMVSALPAVAQYSDDAVFMTVGNKDVTCGEFKRIYTKNNPNAKFDSASITAYLPMFIDYKLKVVEAEAQKLDTASDFRKELQGYRSQLEKPYLTDEKADEALYQEAYKRLQSDVHAAHILIMCSEDAAPADTAKAYKKIQALYKRAAKGEDFSKLARENSEDPSAKRNNGDLGFFTAFSMIYDFEDVAYNTPVGEVSKPFRTRFGYHIIKVYDVRPNPGQVKVAHIMVKLAQNAAGAEAQAAEAKIKMIADSIANGADWVKMVARYSDDRGSSQRGGEQQWFSTGMMVPEFEEASFALQNPGDISAPIRTAYGWHIIKLIDKRGIDPYEELREQIKRRMSGDVRSRKGAKALCDRLKKEYGFKEDKAAYNEIAQIVDSTILQKKWSVEKAAGLNKVLFTFADSIKRTQQDFAKKLSQSALGSERNMSVHRLVTTEYENLVQNAIVGFERTQLERKYPDFRYLLQEYHDGILLFALTDNEVWTKASTDTAGLEQFYEANKQKYMWGERAEIASCTYNGDAFSDAAKKNADTKLAAALKAGVKNADYEEKAKAAMRKIGTEPDSIGLLVKVIKFSIVDGQETDANGNTVDVKYCDFYGTKINQDSWGKSKTKICNIDGHSYVLYLVKNVPPMPKTLNECRGAVVSEYQNVLEKNWIESLRAKYQVKLNNDILKTLIE